MSEGSPGGSCESSGRDPKAPNLSRRSKFRPAYAAALLIPIPIALLILSVILGRASREPERVPQPSTRRSHGVVEVVVVAHLRLLNDQQEPVVDARIVVGPALAGMRTEEEVRETRRAVEDEIAAGMLATLYAIGKSERDGTVTVEFTCFDDEDDPLFGSAAPAPGSRFPFGGLVRIDSPMFGVVLRRLESPTAVRYRFDPSLGRVAEADFLIQCDPDDPLPPRRAGSGWAESDEADAVKIVEKARAARNVPAERN